MEDTFKVFDIGKWDRKDMYYHFSRLRLPHYMVATNIDVSRLLEYKREHGLSFYLSLVYLVTKCMNGIEEFHLRVRDGQVVRYKQIETNFTHRKPGERVFLFHTARFEGSLDEYVKKTSSEIALQTSLFGGMGDLPNVAYCTCTPTLELTACTNPGMEDPNDAIPRVNWGKYVMRDGRWMLNMSIMANHRFIDGYHLEQFFNSLQEEINRL